MPTLPTRTMMAQATPTRRAQPAAKTEAPPLVTDPIFAALLMYVTGLGPDNRDDGDAGLARIAAHAARIVAHPDATAIFDDRLGHVSIHDCIRDELAGPYRRGATDEAEQRRRAVIDAVLADDATDLTANAEDIKDVIDTAVYDAFYIGTAVMYLLLTGGPQ